MGGKFDYQSAECVHPNEYASDLADSQLQGPRDDSHPAGQLVQQIVAKLIFLVDSSDSKHHSNHHWIDQNNIDLEVEKVKGLDDNPASCPVDWKSGSLADSPALEHFVPLRRLAVRLPAAARGNPA
jgi:hypothetical protein